MLLGPFGGQVGEADKAHAMRKSTVNRRLDEIGRENASEIVMLTLRTPHPSRFAILSAVAVTSVASSSRQRRPRAIDVSFLPA